MTPTQKPTDLFTPAAGARLIGVTAPAVHDRINAGKLAVTMVGGRKFVARGDLDGWRKDRERRAELILRRTV